MKAKDLNISDELVDEIVEEILAETSVGKPSETKTSSVKKFKPEELYDGASDLKEKSRMPSFENRAEKTIYDYKTTAIEIERQITEKFTEFEQENEKRLMYLQNQLESLRTAMIRLSSDLKQLKEGVSTQR